MLYQDICPKVKGLISDGGLVSNNSKYVKIWEKQNHLQIGETKCTQKSEPVNKACQALFYDHYLLLFLEKHNINGAL